MLALNTNPSSASTMSKTKHSEQQSFRMNGSAVGLYTPKKQKACYNLDEVIGSTSATGTTKLVPDVVASYVGPTLKNTSSGTKPKKRVSFKDSGDLVQILEFENDLDSKKERKMYWEFYVLDRFRFNERISSVAGVLSPVLDSAHRNRIYSKRMVTTTTAAVSVDVDVPVPTLPFSPPSSLSCPPSPCSSATFMLGMMEVQSSMKMESSSFVVRDDNVNLVQV